MKDHKPGYPVHCPCGVVLHTAKAEKFHRCSMPRPADRATNRQDA